MPGALPAALRPAIGGVETGGPEERARRSPEELELELIRFTSKRRALAHAPRPMHGAGQSPAGWPPAMEAAFAAILGELEVGLQRPPGSLPRRLLIQARVTLEVELEMTAAKLGAPPPAALADRVGRLFGAIAGHMRAAPPLEERRPRLAGAIRMSWPTTPVIVTSPFGYRRDPILGRSEVRFHAGLDLGGSHGDLVHAAAPGRITRAGWLGGHGRTVVIQHAGGYQTIYAHLGRIFASLGEEVDAGAPVGAMGSSGRSTGPHLHFEVHHGGAPIDPLDLVDGSSLVEDGEPVDPVAKGR